MKYLLFLLVLFGASSTNNLLFAQSTTDSKPEKSEVFAYVHQMPSFKGGEEQQMKFIADNIIYPKEAIEKKIQGRVFLSFIVDEEGNIVKPEIFKSLHPLLDQEALRVVSIMPKWIPGKQNGKPVKVVMYLPVTFRLD